ncbi:hypothetical protein ZEAMMB73_Zm00001d016529 [Zea mays]|uniref:Uncharacterized protein n=1 Tax=Zea mays TaxID=4577 RepID=A0A1D6H8Q4_MAIZE|nr:hypothetical protein ZEAMMB73_Zm00001d016529 [Zea mays]
MKSPASVTHKAAVAIFYSCVVQLRSRCYQVPPCLSSINTAYQRAIPLYGGHSRRASSSTVAVLVSTVEMEL